MAVVWGVIEHDAVRREQAVSNARRWIEQTGPNPIEEWRQGNLVILSSRAPSTPVSHQSLSGLGTWCMGDVFVGGRRLTAPDLDARMAAAKTHHMADALQGLNGLYLACHLTREGELSLATDAMGFFPVYLWSTADVCVFSSEPAGMRAHPSFRASFSPHGLAGVLLQGHIANGQTILRDVTRPHSGHVVRWSPGASHTSVSVNAIVPNDALFGAAYEDTRVRMRDMLSQAIELRRGTPDACVGLMLSGGLDSRLVSGVLGKHAPSRVTALIYGEDGDIEVECARRVARSLGLSIARAHARYDRFADLAQRTAQRELLSNTAFDYSWASNAEVLRALNAPLMSGLHGDAVMGGSALPFGLAAGSTMHTFDAYFAADCSIYGFSAADVNDALAGESLADVAGDVSAEMQRHFDAIPGEPFQKVWLWSLENRNRYHASAFAWRLAEYAWPLVPFGDRAVLDLAASLPLDHVNQRRMQRDTLMRDFPKLARLPLDRNSLDDHPLVRTLSWRIQNAIRVRLRALRPQRDLRTYYHTFDINNAGWRSIRERAEASRPQVSSGLTRAALDRFLPPASATVQSRDGIIDPARMKTLLGFLLQYDRADDANSGSSA